MRGGQWRERRHDPVPHDAEGLRVGKATFTAGFPAINVTCAAPGTATGFVLTKQYLLDQSGDQVTELNGSGTWQHSNIWSGSHLDATYDLDTKSSSPALHFQLADPLGTRRVQTNPSGQVEEDCQTRGPHGQVFVRGVESLPFGDGLNCVKTSLSTADDATEHHFTGKERDTESNTGASQTGLDYFGARYYESTMGQWMSPDTDFNLKRILGTPQRWNRYAYVINNPLGRIDPDGNRDVSIVVVRSDPSATPSHGANPVTATTGQYRFQVNGRTLDTGYTIERGGDLRIPSGNYEGKPVQRGATDVHAFVELEGVHDPQNSDRVMTNVEGHLGNFPWDSKGCILFGADLSETTQAYDKYDLQNHSSMMVTDSTNTAIGLQDMMQDVINTDRQNNEPTNIDFEIIDPPIDTVPAPPFPAGGANQHVPS